MARNKFRQMLPVVFKTVEEYKDKGLQMVVLNIEGYFNEETWKIEKNFQSIEVWNAEDEYLPVFQHNYNLISLFRSLAVNVRNDSRRVAVKTGNTYTSLAINYPDTFSFVFDSEHIVDVTEYEFLKYAHNKKPIDLTKLKGYPGNITRGYAILIDRDYEYRHTFTTAVPRVVTTLEDMGLQISYEWGILEGYDIYAAITMDSEDGLDMFESELKDFIGNNSQYSEIFDVLHRIDVDTKEIGELMWS